MKNVSQVLETMLNVLSNDTIKKLPLSFNVENEYMNIGGKMTP